ncbi:MAG: hypothetical protein V2L15_05400 [Desulfobacteraceae bacterium]|nr:hypothetical protein [Desulfobacteraceae bacterium]
MRGPLARLPVATVCVSDVSEIVGRRRQVIVAKTGRTVWLPAAEIQIHPGRVTIPAWLARRIFTGQEIEGGF